VALLAGGLVSFARPAADGRILAALEDASIDWRFGLRGPRPPPAEVVIVALDDATLAGLGRFPVPRRRIAEAIDRLVDFEAGQIGIDLLLVEAEGEPGSAGDAALLAALRRADRPVLAVAGVFQGGPPGAQAIETLRAAALPIVLRTGRQVPGEAPPPLDFLVPVADLRAVAQLGHVNLATSAGGMLRRMPLALPLGDLQVPALPLVLAANRLLVGRNDIVLDLGRAVRLGPRQVPTGAGNAIEINHYGPRGSVPTYSLLDLLQGRIDRDRVAGRTVLIGSTATGFGDTFITPFSRDVPGVEVLASVFGNLLRQDALIRDRSIEGIGILASVGLALLAFLAANLRLLGLSIAAFGILLTGWATVVQFVFNNWNLALPGIEPALAAVIVALFVYAARMRAQRLRSQVLARERANLAEMHAPAIADAVASGDRALFDDRPLQAAVLFVDVVGYTGRSERLGPDGTARFLRHLHETIEAAASAQGGIVTQFIGDGAMLVFGLPQSRPTDAAAALACARDLLAATGLPMEGEPVRLRIGIHFGPVVATRLGGRRHRQISVAGDTVNVASRLEQLARGLETRLAVSDALVNAARESGRGDLLTGLERIQAMPLRGRLMPVVVWALREDLQSG